MLINLADTNPALAVQWRLHLRLHPGLLPHVQVHTCSILDLKAEAVVSPANSFGFMDGGIDALYLQRFGPELQVRLQRMIADQYGGEVLVGEAVAVETHDSEIPVLISAPTMRVPMTVLNPNDIRIATRAAVRVALGLQLTSIAIPGMGTGTGNVLPGWAASLMLAGIVDAMHPRPFPTTLLDAAIDHYRPYLDGSADRLRRPN